MPPRPAAAPAPPPAAPTLATVGELALIARLRRWFRPDPAAVPLGIGDDAALVRTAPGTLVTTDTLVEGVHFRHATIPPRDLGWKALAVNVSDLAAMAGTPLAAFVALSLPATAPLEQVAGFFAGLRTAARALGCPVAGGDLTRAPVWMINVTVLGRPRGAPALRSTARPGDVVCVTGWPGESGAALQALERGWPAPAALLARHRRPVPRVAQAAALHAQVTRVRGARLTLLDVSDGLWHDAHQLARASGVGVELERAALPVSPRLARWCALRGLDPLRFVLFGGEDYELLAAVPPAVARRRPDLHGIPLHPIGRIVPGRGVRLLGAQRQPMRVEDGTFEHF